MGTTRYYLDTMGSDELTDALTLHAAGADATRWNGWEVPHVTATEFERWVSAWQACDPNGTWCPSGVVAHGDTLTYTDTDADHDYPDTWQRVGFTDNGHALYALDGWVWRAFEA